MMLSAQPITLTGEQHDRLWKQAKELRDMARGASPVMLRSVADEVERILLAAIDAAPPATASSGEAA